MHKFEEIKKRYTKFKDYMEEAGPFFRQKEHYSDEEKIAFIVEFYANYSSFIRLFEEDKELLEGKSVTINSKTVLTKRLIEQEFEAAISVIYFNLSKDEILALEDRAKASGGLREALILRKLFEKYLGA
jgi:hypothetical protein